MGSARISNLSASLSLTLSPKLMISIIEDSKLNHNLLLGHFHHITVVFRKGPKLDLKKNLTIYSKMKDT